MSNKVENNKTFKNPILPGFYPDPSLCRVGEEYYMITSSFAFFPGIPIFKSTDLVNWEQIGHVLNRKSQLNLDGSGYSGGIFAPTIRYHEGLFYVITTNTGNGGNFIVTAKDPKGPWSDPYWLEGAEGIDPSLFFDEDGKVYYTGTRTSENPEYMGDHEIWLQEINLNSMKLIGKSHVLWKGALKNAAFVEGPHLYKINGIYYLLISEGGTEHYHSVTIARSKEILGPYEGNQGNPILTHRHLGKSYPISNAGHGDLVETQNGEWYLVALASRPYGGYYKNLGRETFLIPVEWEDGWPIVSPVTGKIEFSYQMPNLPISYENKTEIRDDFDNEVLDYKWNTIRTPKAEFWNLKERPGFLRLKVRPVNLIDKLNPPPFGPFKNYEHGGNTESPSFIGRRQQHINFEAFTKMEFIPKNEHETAGIALIQNDNHQFRLEYSIENRQKVIRLIRCISKSEVDFRTATFEYENIEEEMGKKVFDSEVIYLKAIAKGQEYSFYYGAEPDKMESLAEKIDGRILSSDVAGGFVGTYIGLFASGNGETSDNIADFDWFDYKGEE